MNHDKINTEKRFYFSADYITLKAETATVLHYRVIYQCYVKGVKFLLNWNFGKQLDKLKLGANMHLCISYDTLIEVNKNNYR